MESTASLRRDSKVAMRQLNRSMRRAAASRPLGGPGEPQSSGLWPPEECDGVGVNARRLREREEAPRGTERARSRERRACESDRMCKGGAEAWRLRAAKEDTTDGRKILLMEKRYY